MRVRGFHPLAWLAGVVIIAGGSAALYARQQAAGSVLPGKFLIINKAATESIPVTLVTTDPKFPTLAVAVTTAPDMELGDRTLARLAPLRQVWEYRELVIASGEDRAQALNLAGTLGWEATGLSFPNAKGGVAVVLKRPK